MVLDVVYWMQKQEHKSEIGEKEMRANKNAIIVTSVITAVCLINCIALCKDNNLIYDLSLACFGSALLGIVVATTAYMAERRDAMEQFADEVSKAIVVIANIPVVEISNLVVGALKEENSWFENNAENRDKLKEFIEFRLPVNENTPANQIKEWIDNAYQSELEEARKRLRKGITAYIAIGEYDLSGLNTAFGRLEFLFGNDTIRKQAYHSLYDKIRVFKRSCLDQCRIFKPYLSGHGNEMVCLDKLISLQNQIFDNNDGVYYAKMRDELIHSLETFRSQTYNIEPEYEERYPVHYCINFEDPESVEKYKRHIEKVKQEGRDEFTKMSSLTR